MKKAYIITSATRGMSYRLTLEQENETMKCHKLYCEEDAHSGGYCLIHYLESLEDIIKQQAEQIGELKSKYFKVYRGSAEEIERLQAENQRLKEVLNKALSIVMFPYREPLDKYSDEEQEVIMQKWTVETKDILAAPPQKGQDNE